MEAAIGTTVSSLLIGAAISAVILIVTFLGVLAVIRWGDVHRVKSLTWKRKILGELTLTYGDLDESSKAEDQHAVMVEKDHRPVWKRWLRLKRRE